MRDLQGRVAVVTGRPGAIAVRTAGAKGDQVEALAVPAERAFRAVHGERDHSSSVVEGLPNAGRPGT